MTVILFIGRVLPHEHVKLDTPKLTIKTEALFRLGTT